MFDFVRDANRLLDEGRTSSPAARAAWDLAERVLGIAHRSQARTEIAASAVDADPTVLSEAAPDDREARLGWATRWAAKRVEAKRRRDFAAADAIRAKLAEAKFELRDRRDGSAELVDRS